MGRSRSGDPAVAPASLAQLEALGLVAHVGHQAAPASAAWRRPRPGASRGVIEPSVSMSSTRRS